MGNLVASEMSNIMGSKAHNDLFYKNASENCKCIKDCDECKCSKNEDCECLCLTKEASNKCKCPSDCDCKKDGECNGDCNCACDKGECMDTLSFKDLSYLLNKTSQCLDDIGYDKTATAVIKVLSSMIAEAQGVGKMIDETLTPMSEPDVSTEGMTFEEIGETDVRNQLEELEKLLDEKKYDEFDGRLKMLSDIIDEMKDNEPQLPPAEDAPAGMDVPEEWQSESFNIDELKEASARLDSWLKKEASFQDRELDLDLNLSDILASNDDDLNSNLVESYLDTFEDESDSVVAKNGNKLRVKTAQAESNDQFDLLRYMGDLVLLGVSEIKSFVNELKKKDGKNLSNIPVIYPHMTARDQRMALEAYANLDEAVEAVGRVEMLIHDDPKSINVSNMVNDLFVYIVDIMKINNFVNNSGDERFANRLNLNDIEEFYNAFNSFRDKKQLHPDDLAEGQTDWEDMTSENIEEFGLSQELSHIKENDTERLKEHEVSDEDYFRKMDPDMEENEDNIVDFRPGVVVDQGLPEYQPLPKPGGSGGKNYYGK